MDLNKIRLLSEKRGISLKFIADTIGVTPQALNQMMNKNSCRMVNLQKIAKFFELPVSYFTDENNELDINIKKVDTAINTRLKKLIHEVEMSQVSFAERIGVESGRINKILNNNIDFGVEVIQGIARAFPDINLHWLLLGTGEMKQATSLVADHHTPYLKTCKNCEQLLNTNNNLNKFIKTIEKELEECKKQLPEEKRKVG